MRISLLRDEAGTILAEDDDGALGLGSRIVFQVDSPALHLAEACALHGERGPFELSLSRGDPRVLPPEEERRAERAELERTVEAREHVLGPEHPGTASSLYALAKVLQDQNDLSAARACLERALAIREAVLGPEHPDTLKTLNVLALVLSDQGDFGEARACFERALEVSERLLGPDHSNTAIVLNNLACLLQDQGDFAEARACYERALPILEKTRGPTHAITAALLNNLSLVLKSQGDYSAARPCYERVLQIRERTLGAEHPLTASSLNNLAILLVEQGDYGAARPYAERALAIIEKVRGPEHPELASCLNTLALALKRLGDHATALQMYERALTIWEQALGPEHLYTARTLNNLSALLEGLGDRAAARAHAEHALAITEETLGPEHPETGNSLNNLALALRGQGDFAAARSCSERALAITAAVFGTVHPETAQACCNHALLLADSAQPAAAWESAWLGWTSSRALQRRLLASLTEVESYAYLATLRSQLESLLSLAGMHPPVASERAYEAVLAWKGQVARVLLISRGQMLARMTDQERGLLERLRSTQAELSRLAFAVEAPEPVSREARIQDLRETRNELELELRRAARDELVDDAAYPSLRASLPGGAALLDFLVHRTYRAARREGESVVESGAWQEPRLSVWITRGDLERPLELDLGPASAVETALEAFLADLVGGRTSTAERGIGSVQGTSERDSNTLLRASLWDPLAPHLVGVDTLFVCPDGFLGTLPLETLRLADGSYLIERYACVYLQDPTSLVRLDARDTGLDSLLCMGGVNYGRRSGLPDGEQADSRGALASASDLRGTFAHSWPALPYTIQESEIVTELHARAFAGGRRLLVQEAEATEERLKRELSGHSVVHLATHGFFNPEGVPSLWAAALADAQAEDPQLSEEGRVLVGKHPGLLCGLVCAGASAGAEAGEDGYLTAEEVGWLDLSGVELVVLSACETALGRAQSGEGLLGLRRAFEIAGAKTVISSLWSVRDESTALLMQHFYENLWVKQQDRLAALRNAQLRMLAQNRSEHGDALPGTWGAFVLSGEWR